MDVPIPKGDEFPNAEHAASAPPKKGRLGNLLNSPILLVALILATAVLAFKWYSLEASLRAPDLPGWSWSAHPNTLLIYYPHTDCGCGPGLSPVLTQARTHHLDVLVLTDIKGEKLATLSKQASGTQAHLTFVDQKAFQGWIRLGNTTMLLIRHGHIKRRMSGTNITSDFFNR